MRGCLTTILVGVLMFIFVVGIILLLGIALNYVLQFIPCEILVYIETGVLLGLFMLIATLLATPEATKVLLARFSKKAKSE